MNSGLFCSSDALGEGMFYGQSLFSKAWAMGKMFCHTYIGVIQKT